MRLSLIVIYRNREHHLRSQISWWKSQTANVDLSDCELIIIEADKNSSPWIHQEIYNTSIQYCHLYGDRVLHKTKALNLGLRLSQGLHIAPFDVDLIPLENTLQKHLGLAELSPYFLVTGYRLMSKVESVAPETFAQALKGSSIAPEDMPTALYKHLIHGERFGVLPMFKRDRLLSIGGWDETFVGWGAEDQDLIERYLQDDLFLCRCPNLVYLHLHHDPQLKWHESSLIEKNRAYYYHKKAQRLTKEAKHKD
jgi:hypothetical protein